MAAGTREAIGWRFWLKPRLTLTVCVAQTPLVSRKLPSDFCFADCWQCGVAAEGAEGRVEGAFVDHASMVVAVLFRSVPEGVSPVLAGSLPSREGSGCTVYAGHDWWVAVSAGPEEASRRFGVAISYRDEAEAVARAEAARKTEVALAIRNRMAFYRGAAVPESLAGNLRRAFYKAVSVQKVNIESPQADIPCHWTTPDRMPHRSLWLWDSAFHALGLQHLSVRAARDAIRAVFAKQRPDGQVRLAVQPGGDAPQPDNETQPPVLAWSVCQQSQRLMQLEFLRDVYPNLVRYLDWYEAHRRQPNGLYGWRIRTGDDPVRGARGGESGMDNSPRFDSLERITAVDLSSYLASEYFAMERIARCLERPGDVSEWRQRRLQIADRVNELLWDDETRFYYDLDEAGEFVRIKTVAGFMPLLGQIPDRDRAEALRMHLMNPNEFWLPFPAPTVARDEATFSPDLWRGATWLNTNTLIYYGLMAYGFFQEARRLARASIQEVARNYMLYGCFYECYDASGAMPPSEMSRKGAPGEKGGVGFGVVEDFHWTAACYVHLAHELG